MNAKEYKDASSRMEELLGVLTDKGKLGKKQQLELDRISEVISLYEEEHYPFRPETLIEMIELRMFQRKLKQKDLARILGTTPSRISEILNGKRDLTMDLARELYKKLNVDPKLILSE
ncbi:MAG: helix-turn-helix domain-containing protein [Saprospiraceae bacterium]|nr:helix-turn-helix domain-containing protein [Saprospiraceae bacterium]